MSTSYPSPLLIDIEASSANAKLLQFPSMRHLHCDSTEYVFGGSQSLSATKYHGYHCNQKNVNELSIIIVNLDGSYESESFLL